MRLYGVATALTGNRELGDDVQPIVDLTCTTVFVDRSDLYTKHNLPKHTFKARFDSTNPLQMRQAYRRVAAALSYATSNQEAELVREGEAYRPVAFIVGKDAKITYAVPDIRKAFLEAEKDDIGIRHQLAQDLQKSYLRLSNYRNAGLKKSGRYSRELESLDKALREARATSYHSGCDQGEVLEEQITIAEDLGRLIARRFAHERPTFLNWAGNVTQQMSVEELKRIHPLCTFDAENILIRQAMTRGYKEQTRVDGIYIGSPYIKPPLEPRSRFFADVAHAMIWNQYSVIAGTDTVEDTSYQDDREYREQLIADMSAGPQV